MSYETKRRLNNEDRRVKRTKKALREAFLKLLETKTVDQITVTELTSLADVNRATFYFYYTDILDMLQQIQNEVYQLFVDALHEHGRSINSLESSIDYIELLLNICKENEAVVRFIIKNDINNRIYKEVLKFMLHSIPDSKKSFDTTNPARYTTVFLVNAFIGSTIDWMNEGMVIPARDMAEFFTTTYIKGSFITNRLYSEK